MKKQLTVLLAVAVTAGLMVGCTTQKQETSTTTAAVTETSSETQNTEETTEETTEVETTVTTGYKTGLAIVSSMTKSTDATDTDGNAQVDSVAVAVVLDEDGKITQCVIDTAQNKMAFTPEGKVVMSTDFKTKKELGDDYGMKPASSIGKEWFEQAASLEEYVIGKTIAEIQGIAVNEDTVPQEEDLTSSVTIKIGDYIEAIVEAAESAEVLGTNPTDKLGLGIVTNMDKSKDAEEDQDGQNLAYSTYVALTTDKDDLITASIIDCTQGTVTFDQTGKITSDLTAGVKTKRQLGDAYGMKGASGIGKEWYEQAAAFSEYIIGKTAAEVSGIAIDEDSKTTAEDLISSVTISIGDYQTAIEKADK